MKRLNLSFYNPSREWETKDAVLRVTYPQPERLVGELRASRFKISKGAFPLFYLGPDDTLFTTAEKNSIDLMEMTPTGFAWGFILTERNEMPCGSDAYLLRTDDVPLPCSPVGGNYNPLHIIYNHIYLAEPPLWVKVGERWKLKNESHPVFDWNYLTEAETEFTVVRYSDLYCQDCIKPAVHGVEFSLIYKDLSGGNVSTPVNFLSRKALVTIKNNNEESTMFSLKTATIVQVGDGWLTTSTSFYTTSGKVTYSKQIEGVIASQAHAPPVRDLSTSVYYDFELGSGNLLFPYTAIVVVIDELNFLGDSIVINNPDLTGVITPSMLSVFKTFVVGMEGGERSDYVVTDDTLTQSPLLINCPTLNTLTIRLFMLTKQNDLIKMKIPHDEGFFIQLTIR